MMTHITYSHSLCSRWPNLPSTLETLDIWMDGCISCHH